MSGDPRPTPRAPVPVPTPPPRWWYQAQALARRSLVYEPAAVIWRARCPHGAEGDWTAYLVGESSTAEITVHCSCEEAA